MFLAAARRRVAVKQVDRPLKRGAEPSQATAKPTHSGCVAGKQSQQRRQVVGVPVAGEVGIGYSQAAAQRDAGIEAGIVDADCRPAARLSSDIPNRSTTPASTTSRHPPRRFLIREKIARRSNRVNRPDRRREASCRLYAARSRACCERLRILVGMRIERTFFPP